MRASCRGFEAMFDEPVEMGGPDTGIQNPVEVLNADVRTGLQDVRTRVRLKCADKDAARTLARLAEERCHVGDRLKNAVPVSCVELAIE